MNHEELRTAVRRYSTQYPPYDYVGVMHLLLAALDNLQENALEADLEVIAYTMTDAQRVYLKQVAEYACRMTDEMIAAEDES